MMRGRALLLAGALAGACAACIGDNYRQRVPLPERLAWLHEGTTERSEVFERLGPPRRSFENERIQIWDVYLQVGDEAWTTDHTLVLVFGEDQRVVRSSVVRLD
jgi:hypothetical protein